MRTFTRGTVARSKARHVALSFLTVAFSIMPLLLAAGSSALAQTPALNAVYQIGGTGRDYGRASAVDANGNIYVTGSFNGTVDFDPGSGTAILTSVGNNWTSDDIFVASYDASGNYRWAFRTGGGDGESIAVDGNGNVVVSGVFAGTADFDPGPGTANLTAIAQTTTTNMFVARYTSNGNYLWAFNVASVLEARLAVDGSNNIVVTGQFRGTGDFNPGTGKANLASAKSGATYSDDIFVAKYTSSGAYAWAFKVGGTGSGESASAVDVDGNGNVYVTGNFQSTADFNPSSSTANLVPNGAGDAFVAKYTAAGGYIWAFRLGGASTTDVDFGSAITVDANGNFVLAGDFIGTADFNPGTGTANLTAAGTDGIFVASYTASGGYQWAFTPGRGAANAVTLDASGDIYTVGSFTGPNDFDPGTGTASLPVGASGAGGFVAKYTGSGAHLWSFSTTATQLAPAGVGITVDGNGAITVMGRFYATAYFDPGDATASLTSAGNMDIFIAKYIEPTLPKRSLGSSGQIAMQVAPNPFTDDFTVSYNGISASAHIDIVDMMGRVVESIETADARGQIRLGAELPAGAYLVRVREGETTREMMVRKMR
jgi:hypothetical protein